MLKKIAVKSVLVLLFVILMSSCSIFSPVKDNYTNYILNSMPCDIHKSYGSRTLYVSQVAADPLYNTSDMAYSTNPYQVEYFAKNKWSDDPAKMLRPLIIRTLERTRHFHAVTETQGSIQYDYILNIRLLELRQIFLVHSSFVVLKLHAEIVNAKTGRIVASKNITSEQYARCRNPSGGVIAANIAVAEALKKLSNFCIRSI